MLKPFKVNTDGYEGTLVFDIESTRPVSLAAKGYDADPAHPFTTFFSRYQIVGPDGSPAFSGRREIEFPLAVSPKELLVNIFHVDRQDNKSTSYLIVHNIKAVPLEKKTIWKDSYTEQFLLFIREFSIKCGYLKAPSGWDSECGNFKIDYLPYLTGKNGTKSSTPARIFRKEGIIQVSAEMFRPITVPMRIMILCHEFGHHYLDIGDVPEDELKCDAFGMNLALSMGLSKIEILHALTKIMNDGQMANKRVNAVFEHLKKVSG